MRPKIVGIDKDKIVREAMNLLNDKGAYDEMAKAVNPFGDGKASKRIIDVILRVF
jgi:UDP-N-acetylglucosamine 2-epimerase (non-hydrolysing)